MITTKTRLESYRNFLFDVKLYKRILLHYCMKKEDVAVLAQLLATMKEVALQLETAIAKKDYSSVQSAKKEILELQKQVDRML